ncbi:hypothetical protein FQR65_LT00823 [Abscondita terminalis]|nr:hypothetical protein FQR65_LT00823 [Abscondita terminalis]
MAKLVTSNLLTFPMLHRQPKYQSPININTSFLDHREDYPILWSSGFFEKPEEIHLRNNSHTLQLTVVQEEPLFVTSKYFCCKRFYFKHINFHWGYNHQNGSEHSINGIKYPVEMQAVYHQYKTAYLPNVLIISYFFELTNKYHWGLKKVLEVAPLAAKERDQKMKLRLFPLKELLYTPLFSYYTYDGSRTTPPYEENVRWVICEAPLPLCQNQLDVFKNLGKSDKGLRNNCRNIQSRNFRVVTYFIF